MLCSDTEYSDFKKCFNCQAEEYFNVETKICVTCNGAFNATTKICIDKSYTFTNLNSNSVKRIVNMTNSVDEENATINRNLTVNKNSKLCATDMPYFTTKGCSNCSKQAFDYKISLCVPVQCKDPAYPNYDPTVDRCTECPAGKKYDERVKKCFPILYVTNLNAIYFYIEEGNYTK